MIQRKQTLYLFFAIICFILTTFLPLGTVENAGMGIANTITSLGLINGNDGAISYPFSAIPMFFLALNAFYSLAIIFMYKNRKTQALNCYIQILAIVVEAIASGVLIMQTCIADEQTFHAGSALSLPIVAIIFILLAHHGIMADEKLIRSVDRIR